MEVTEEGEQSFIVSWTNHHGSLGGLFENYFLDETFADCSLAAGSKEITAHKIILSVCSPFFNTILRRHREKHPIIVIEHALPEDLQAIVEYMYKGEVHVPQKQLHRFLELADSLQIAGLVSRDEKTDEEEVLDEDEEEEEETVSKKRTWSESNKEEFNFKSEEMALEVNEEYLLDEPDTGVVIKDEDPLSVPEITQPEPVAVKSTILRKPRVGKIKAKMADKKPMAPFTIIEDGEYRMQCNTCGGLYKSHTTYLNHYRYDCNVSHACDTCTKVFKNKRHLLDHVRDDCGRYHICGKCNREFTQKVNLTTHQKHYCRPGEAKVAKTIKTNITL